MAHIDAESFDTPMVINAYTIVWPAKEAFLCNMATVTSAYQQLIQGDSWFQQTAHDILTLDKLCSLLHVVYCEFIISACLALTILTRMFMFHFAQFFPIVDFKFHELL